MFSLQTKHLFIGLGLLGASCVFHACKSTSASITLELSGPCENCPPDRLNTVLKDVKGIEAVNFSDANNEINIQYDSSLVKLSSIIGILNESGYDAGENLSTMVSNPSPCCVLSAEGITDELDIEEDESEADSLANDLDLSDLDDLDLDDVNQNDDINLDEFDKLDI
ncbi:MAG: heavy-metal-associated domain-containing protein [Bacteroidia bacterium]|nr:heavy-metal-associated domain-containing protein [Bacteroidia bacterium]